MVCIATTGPIKTYQMESMNDKISKIEDALIMLSENPVGSWGELLKGWKTPYYGFITGFLSRRGLVVPEGNGLRWVGDKPTRTLAGLLYEEAKEYANKSKKIPSKKEIVTNAIFGVGQKAESPALPVQSKDDLTRGLAIMEHAIKAGVVDPVAFAKALLKDSRI